MARDKLHAIIDFRHDVLKCILREHTDITDAVSKRIGFALELNDLVRIARVRHVEFKDHAFRPTSEHTFLGSVPAFPIHLRPHIYTIKRTTAVGDPRERDPPLEPVHTIAVERLTIKFTRQQLLEANHSLNPVTGQPAARRKKDLQHALPLPITATVQPEPQLAIQPQTQPDQQTAITAQPPPEPPRPVPAIIRPMTTVQLSSDFD